MENEKRIYKTTLRGGRMNQKIYQFPQERNRFPMETYGVSGEVGLIYIMRNFCLRKNLKSPETMEVRK